MDKELVGAVQHKMDNQAKATPRPWRYEEGTKTIRAVPSNYWIATMNSFDGAVDNEATAYLIVKAVNNHEQLLEACREAIYYFDGTPQTRDLAKTYEKLSQAIANVENK